MATPRAMRAFESPRLRVSIPGSRTIWIGCVTVSMTPIVPETSGPGLSRQRAWRPAGCIMLDTRAAAIDWQADVDERDEASFRACGSRFCRGKA